VVYCFHDPRLVVDAYSRGIYAHIAQLNDSAVSVRCSLNYVNCNLTTVVTTTRDPNYAACVSAYLCHGQLYPCYMALIGACLQQLL
jgi:endonuclease III-like uncharacterized protein